LLSFNPHRNKKRPSRYQGCDACNRGIHLTDERRNTMNLPTFFDYAAIAVFMIGGVDALRVLFEVARK
jgi:hypothetical protein